MNKILTSLGLYWHLILDIILTHVYVIAFLHAGFPATAAVLMSLDSVLKILLSVFISHFIVRLGSSRRYKTSVMIRFILIAIWFAAVFQLPFTDVSMLIVIPYFIFKLLVLLDSILSADLIFAVHETFHIDLSRSAAAQNILARAVTAFAPALALSMLMLAMTKILVLVISALVGVYAAWLMRGILFVKTDHPFQQQENDKFSLTKLIKNPVMKWGISFQILGNLAFAGVAFLLLAQLRLNGNVFFNEITALYAAFLFAQTLVLVFGENAVPLNQPRQIAWLMGICGLLILLTSMNYFIPLKLLLCAGIGLCYSFVLSGLQKVITTKLRGSGFIHYAGWSQTLGRFASLLVIILLGFAMRHGFSAAMLLGVAGGFGMLAAIMLGVISKNNIINYI